MEANVPRFPIKADEKTISLISSFLSRKNSLSTLKEKKLSLVRITIFVFLFLNQLTQFSVFNYFFQCGELKAC